MKSSQPALVDALTMCGDNLNGEVSRGRLSFPLRDHRVSSYFNTLRGPIVACTSPHKKALAPESSSSAWPIAARTSPITRSKRYKAKGWP